MDTYWTYSLLVGELIIITTFEPQAVHDSGVQPNHQCRGNNCQDQPRQAISLGHPLLSPHLYAEFTFLIKGPDHELRYIEY